MFCEKCAELTRQLVYDPTVEPFVELMSGSLIWKDEICREWCIQCSWNTREWFHFRYQLNVGDSVPTEAMSMWRSMQEEFPNWPLFRVERCSSEHAEKVRRMVKHATTRACIGLEKAAREREGKPSG